MPPLAAPRAIIRGMEHSEPLQETPAAEPVYALFESGQQAREAMAALEESGVPASAVSVAEVQSGIGVVFGPGTSFTPGDSPYAWSGPYGNLYPAAIAGSFNPSIVETPDLDLLAGTIVDQGLSPEDARSSATAILGGAVFVVVNPAGARPSAEEIGGILTANGGRRA